MRTLHLFLLNVFRLVWHIYWVPDDHLQSFSFCLLIMLNFKCYVSYAGLRLPRNIFFMAVPSAEFEECYCQSLEVNILLLNERWGSNSLGWLLRIIWRYVSLIRRFVFQVFRIFLTASLARMGMWSYVSLLWVHLYVKQNIPKLSRMELFMLTVDNYDGVWRWWCAPHVCYTIDSVSGHLQMVAAMGFRFSR